MWEISNSVFYHVFVYQLANKSGFNESDLRELPAALIPEEQTWHHFFLIICGHLRWTFTNETEALNLVEFITVI